MLVKNIIPLSFLDTFMTCIYGKNIDVFFYRNISNGGLSMYIKNYMNRQYHSLLAAVLILIMSISAPAAAFASESEAPDVSTESTTGADVQSAVSASTESAADVSAQSASGVTRAEPFHYRHDPMENPNAAKDIVVNPEAVYGYSPSPDSVRLKQYVDYLDWTDQDAVAAGRREREEYHESFSTLYRTIEDMLGQGKNVEEIARAVSKARNDIRLASYDGDPEGLAKVKESNLQTYGQEEGPTPDQLYDKYGSWQTVIEKALSSNPGMDACLGLYDEYYDTYDIPDRLSALQTADDNTITGAQTEASAASGSEDAQTEAGSSADDESETPSGASRTYTVKKGDCLWEIAASELGDGSRWQEIYELNRSEIDNPRLIYAGQEFVLPAA